MADLGVRVCVTKVEQGLIASMGQESADERAARLGAALRENLKRRKRQARERAAGPEPVLTRVDHDAATEVAQAMLSEHAQASGHPFAMETFAFEAAINGKVAGRLAARLLNGWMMIAYLAVDESARGHGLGTLLMARIEAEAVAAGALGLAVDTYVFQAPAFYPRLGYEETMRLQGPEPGLTRIFFVKRLGGETPGMSRR